MTYRVYYTRDRDGKHFADDVEGRTEQDAARFLMFMAQTGGDPITVLRVLTPQRAANNHLRSER